MSPLKPFWFWSNEVIFESGPSSSHGQAWYNLVVLSANSPREMVEVATRHGRESARDMASIKRIWEPLTGDRRRRKWRFIGITSVGPIGYKIMEGVLLDPIIGLSKVAILKDTTKSESNVRTEFVASKSKLQYSNEAIWHSAQVVLCTPHHARSNTQRSVVEYERSIMIFRARRERDVVPRAVEVAKEVARRKSKLEKRAWSYLGLSWVTQSDELGDLDESKDAEVVFRKRRRALSTVEREVCPTRLLRRRVSDIVSVDGEGRFPAIRAN